MSKSYKPTSRQIQDWNINNKLAGSSQPDVMELSLRLPKEMSLDSIQKAYQALLKRHDILRTYFPVINDEVMQEIDDYNPETFVLADLYSYSRDEIMNEREEAINQLKDVKNAPLIYGALLHIDTELVFLILIHHMLCDAWSKRILLIELEALCFQFHTKTLTKLESNVVQMSDYYDRNQELIDKSENESLNYWKNELSDKSWQVDFNKIYFSCLGSASGILKVKKFKGWENLNNNDFYSNSRGETYSTYITGTLYEKLKIFCSETRLGMNSILIGGMSILGMEMSGNENVLLRMVYHGRDDNTKLKIVGNLLGCLLLYFQLKKDDTFQDTILNYYNSLSKSINKVIYNSEKLEKLQVTARCFSSFNFLGKNLTGNDRISIQDLEPQIGKTQSMWCPLHCTATEFTNTILFSCAYHSNYYDSEIIISIFKRYFEILEYIVTYPEQKLNNFVNYTATNHNSKSIQTK